MRAVVVAMTLGLLFLTAPGCDSGSMTLAEVDPNAVPQHPSFAEFDNVVQRQCAPCHGPSEPALETCQQIISLLDDIKEQIDSNAMPVGAWPRLTSEERLIVERFVNDYKSGTATSPCD